MHEKFRYTTLAHRYTARFPILTYVSIQINFWILANILLVALLYLQSEIISQAFGIPALGNLVPILILAVVLGISYGIILGLTGYYLDRTVVRNQPLGKVIVVKAMISLVVLILLLAIIRYSLFEKFISPSLSLPGISLNDKLWTLVFYMFLIYYFVMTMMISFINQINKKYGPGVLIPLLLGRYRHPREEERIFMFMDLKSSTATAEKLGHLQYSSFIRDCFSDINDVLYPFCAQVYQYVGDEIVVSWEQREGLKNLFCIEFYFACRNQFQRRDQYYVTNYGVLPEFKAGIHAGTVTAVEIGEVKRDIAYHGDVLNTAARIQSLCNEYGQSFIGSEFLLSKVGAHPNIKTNSLGMILLKGKTTEMELLSIDWTESPD